MNLESQKGTYALIFQANTAFVCNVGKHHNFEGKVGRYIYVGSAFGPGGVRARIIHHLKTSSKPHWHLDYIRPYIQPVAVCFCYSSKRQEHQWAAVVGKIAGAQTPMHNFGSTDCTCPSHLFFFQKLLVTETLLQHLGKNLSHSQKLHSMKLTVENIRR
ncbi:GIY-YIG nuclease family protein, partial [Kaarinaea lacus]